MIIFCNTEIVVIQSLRAPLVASFDHCIIQMGTKDLHVLTDTEEGGIVSHLADEALHEGHLIPQVNVCCIGVVLLEALLAQYFISVSSFLKLLNLEAGLKMLFTNTYFQVPSNSVSNIA
jgi:hypothetical protein